MNPIFKDDNLDRLETDPDFDGGFPTAIVKAFRKRMQHIRAADDERDFYNMRSLNFEKLKGNRKNQYSIRLNDQWRLILEFEGSGQNKKVIIICIEDYH
jgi:proteic killer suppression protein